MPLAIKDGSTWRYPRILSVKDGSTWRTIKQVYIKDGSTSRTLYRYLGSMVVGSNGSNWHGFVYGSFGSLNFPNDAIDGKQIREMDYYAASGETYFVVGNFVAGNTTGITQTNFFDELTLGSTTITAAGACAFSNTGARAMWTWAGDPLGITGLVGQTKALYLSPA